MKILNPYWKQGDFFLNIKNGIIIKHYIRDHPRTYSLYDTGLFKDQENREIAKQEDLESVMSNHQF